jgi:type I restriction enzyme S subunit
MSDELPQGRATLPLGEVATLQRGFDLPVQNRQAGDVPVMASNGPVGTHKVPRVQGPGVVTGRSGTIGKVHYIEGAFWPLNTTLYVKDFHGNHPKFIALLLTFFGLERYHAGTGVPTLNRNIVHEVPVSIPPLAEQRRIVAKVEELLARVNAARERLARVPAILKRFRQAVLAAACSGRLTAAWRDGQAANGETASALLHQILKQRRGLANEKPRYTEPLPPETPDLEELPDHWTWTTVDAIATKVVDGVHKKPRYVADGVPFITVRNLTAGRGISFENLNYITRSDHQEFIKRANPEFGDILITKDGTLGVVRAIRTKREFSIFVSVAMVKPVMREMTHFLEVALSAPQVQEGMVHTGTGLQHIHLRDLRATTLPLPPLAEQHEIVRRVEALFQLADAIEKRVAAATQRADKLTQAILAKAFRGELVPTEAELARAEGRDYEPASALLERIQNERNSAAKSDTARRSPPRRRNPRP